MPRNSIKTQSDSFANQPMRPALTPEARESQMIALATNLAEEQLRNGTASSQVITHFLKLGTVREQLELEKLNKENKMLEAKTDAIKSAAKVEELYGQALEAMRSYGGTPNGEDEDL